MTVPSEPSVGIGWLSVAFGLANASIGVGVLNYPSAYDKVGGIAIAEYMQLIIVAIIMFSMFVLIYCADISKGNTYHEVLSNICGKRAEIVVAVDICLATYGICIAYLVTIGDQYDRIFMSYFGDNFCQNWYLDRRFTITVTSLFIAPLCYLKQLDFLRHTGPLGIVSMLYVVILTIYQHYALDDVKRGTIKTSPESFSSLLSVIPVMCFGYQCNEVVIPIYASMRNRRIKNYFKAAFIAWTTLIFLYGTVGYFGYTTFGSLVLPDIIQMFNARDPFVMIGVCALIFKMAITYPQMSFVGRGSFVGVYGILTKQSANDLEKREKCRRFIISSLWFASTLFFGIFAPDIGLVIEILGTLSVLNVFMFPSACLICLVKRTDLRLSLLVKSLFVITAIILSSVGIGALALVSYQIYVDIGSISQETKTLLCSL
ncbi:putative sodium-coupled neutral amino acid transporter 7-like protein [Dinothrombium tinctorium]|uniref:Putative sodium-coupled neutral amino acid transporter 7-like protein n=1 Tax=Dinothrombium tinctorium TaxID=1965070 RepID=A0A3S3P1Z1_9ACAR|nr:putative sodium-coupled neutral amino acid transporter 7-like protein [Dinothrombium tinctorium]RWS06340.1 putative sodium-coupled neutral amino acid transporter 7-like protein [Dinothrombium tinctorium]RWS15618.1 putative sodium-coupled neutral amino acid transporter 7-like protein [Dinothrombium tinctorium]